MTRTPCKATTTTTDMLVRSVILTSRSFESKHPIYPLQRWWNLTFEWSAIVSYSHRNGSFRSWQKLNHFIIIHGKTFHTQFYFGYGTLQMKYTLLSCTFVRLLLVVFPPVKSLKDVRILSLSLSRTLQLSMITAYCGGSPPAPAFIPLNTTTVIYVPLKSHHCDSSFIRPAAPESLSTLHPSIIQPIHL